MPREWVVDVRDQCRDYGVPFFFKQWGGTRKHLKGRKLDGREYSEMPVAADRPSELVLDMALTSDRNRT